MRRQRPLYAAYWELVPANGGVAWRAGTAKRHTTLVFGQPSELLVVADRLDDLARDAVADQPAAIAAGSWLTRSLLALPESDAHCEIERWAGTREWVPADLPRADDELVMISRHGLVAVATPTTSYATAQVLILFPNDVLDAVCPSMRRAARTAASMQTDGLRLPPDHVELAAKAASAHPWPPVQMMPSVQIVL